MYYGQRWLLLATILLLAAGGFPGQCGEITPALRARLRGAGPAESVRVIVYRRGVWGDPASNTRRVSVRAWKAEAARLEGPLRQALRANGVRVPRSLWAMNAVAFSASPPVARALANRSDVERVDVDPLYSAPRPPVEPITGRTASVSWNLTRIRADALWAEGVDGAGVTVGVIDTGADAGHPDLAGKVLPGQWRDVVNGLPAPYDDNGHGTHVAGIICGGAAGNSPIGVAPGATLLVAKALDAANQFYLSSVVEAGQWMVDPNDDGDTSDAPAVINCSWTLDSATATDFRPVLQLWRSVGIVAVFAAGNRGPGGWTTDSPGNDPLALGIGMTDPADAVADASGRGPAPEIHPFNGVLKPDLTAPGVSILSARPGGQYGHATGTSMAAPHVSGAIALMRQALPFLDVEETIYRLTATAMDAGIPGPDPAYGHGRLDAYAAVHMAPGYAPPAIVGRVCAGDGSPMMNAVVDAAGARAVAGPDGRFAIPHVGAFNVPVTVDAPGFAPLTQTVTTGTEAVFTLAPRVESVLANGGMERAGGWEVSHAEGLARTKTANRTPGGAWALLVAATGDGLERYWLSEPVPVSSGGLVTLSAVYSWRGVGDTSGRITALVWQDGAGRDIRADYGTPEGSSRRGGPNDGAWRTVLQAFRAIPPPGAAWVRLRLGGIFDAGDAASRLWFDDASLNTHRAAGAGAISGTVAQNGAPVFGAIVGEHPFGDYFAPSDAGGRFVLVLPAGPHSISVWAPGARPSAPRELTLAANGTWEGQHFVLTAAGPNAAPGGVHAASSTMDPSRAPNRAADGLLETAWSSAIGSGSPGSPVWWSVDLGAERVPGSVEIWWESAPVHARVSVSRDGVEWMAVAEGHGPGWRRDSTHALSAVRLDDLSARFVRVEDIGSNPLGRMGLWEVPVRIAPPAVPGDADGGGVLNAADVATLLRAAGGLSDAVPVFENGDLTPHGGDGAVTLSDALAAARLWAAAARASPNGV